MGFFDKEEVPPAPDMSGVINAAREIGTLGVDLGKETLDWAKTQFAENKGQIDQFVEKMTSDSDAARGMIQEFQDLSNKQIGLSEGAVDIKEAAMQHAGKQGAIQDTQLGIQQDQLGWQEQLKNVQQGQLGLQGDFRQDQYALQQKADQLFNQYSQTYEPAQARFMADAEAYGTPEKIAQARAGAQANVGDQFQAARDAAQRQLEGYGLDPTDTRHQALDFGTRIKEAALKAAMGDQAALTAEDRAFALRQAAIAQGQQLPGQANQAGAVANQAGSNVVGQGNVANTAGQVANTAGQVANAAGTNAIGAGNAATSAMQAGTGAQAVGVNALQGANQAQTGALAANTAGANITDAAGRLINQTYQTGSQAIGQPTQYLNIGQQGVQGAAASTAADYENQMKEFKAEQTNTSGLGALVGSLAGPVLKAAMTGGASIPGDLAGAAMSGGYDVSKTGGGNPFPSAYGFAEGGAIPMSASPTGGQAQDDVRAQLNAGEFIVPRDVASWYGEKFFQNLIQKAQGEKSKAQAKPAIGPATPGPPNVVSGPGPAIPMGA